MSVQRGTDEITAEISEREGFETRQSSSLTGGSINQVYLLDTNAGKKVLKLNKAAKFPGMFEAEKDGLETLKSSGTIDIPHTYSCGKIGSMAYLLLEYKPEGKKRPDFWKLFAEDLALLHRTSAPEFGFHSSNYIGSLPQYNGSSSSAADFYISQRLEPQIKMASEQGFSFNGLDRIYKNISSEIPEEPPALIHGDLWSGNYLVNEDGLVCLIDPAVCYGPREMDLAMMKLFGGYPEKAFERYNDSFPTQPGFTTRIPLWQLYYLLVHLNIFGSSYLSGVEGIFRKYS